MYKSQDGRLGIVIDGTGKDLNKIGRQKKLLDQLGYETMMIFANTSLEIAQQRNKERTRTLPEKAVAEMWSQVQKNIGGFQQLFGSRNFIIVDNNDPNEPPHIEVFKRVKILAKKKVTNGIAKAWIARELQMKKRT